MAEAIPAGDFLLCRQPHGAGSLRMLPKFANAGRYLGGIAIVHQIPVHSVVDNFGNAAVARADTWLRVTHRFQKNNAETFLRTGKSEDVAFGVLPIQVVLFD